MTSQGLRPRISTTYRGLDPTSLSTEYTTDEEEINLYRVCNDTLLIPGLDATEDNLLGNVYIKRGESPWEKNRTLELAWHVHDVICMGETLYAAGSGGTLEDYNNASVNAFLWRLDTGSQAFQIDQQLPHPNPPGDQRFYQLAKSGELLYAFGFIRTSNNTTTMAYSKQGERFEPLSLDSFFVLNTYPLSDDAVLVGGFHIGTTHTRGVLLGTTEGFTPVESLIGISVWDIYPLGDGRALVLFTDGDEFPDPIQNSYSTKVGLLDENLELTLMTHEFFHAKPTSIAFWKNHLFLGLADGSLLKNRPR